MPPWRTVEGHELRGFPVAVINAFSRGPFSGNPAAVCLLPGAAPAEWMQRVAAELNLSETAFVVPRPEGFGLRWFTPVVEVDLCGHATLASAHALWESGRVPASDPITFHTQVSGTLTCELEKENWIVMDFPRREVVPAEPPAGLAEAVGGAVEVVHAANQDLLVEMADVATLRGLRPDFRRLRALPCRGVIVTARGDDRPYQFQSRFFAPALGIDEDPVTGSAHCALVSYWVSRVGQTALLGWQASARGGEVYVRWQEDRVDLGGEATTVWRGVWCA